MGPTSRLGLAGGAAVVLAFTTAAWACTQATHRFTISSPSSVNGVNPGNAGTVVTASGFCSTTGCPTGTVQLRQDATPSAGVKSVDDHQTSCDASDPSIGTVTAAGSVTGSGIIAARTAPGPYIICAGDTNASTEILWDNFILT